MLIENNTSIVAKSFFKFDDIVKLGLRFGDKVRSSYKIFAAVEVINKSIVLWSKNYY